MARQTKAQKIAKLAELLAVRYQYYVQSLKKDGDEWLDDKEYALRAQRELEELIGAKINLVEPNPWD